MVGFFSEAELSAVLGDRCLPELFYLYSEVEERSALVSPPGHYDAMTILYILGHKAYK